MLDHLRSSAVAALRRVLLTAVAAASAIGCSNTPSVPTSDASSGALRPARQRQRN